MTTAQVTILVPNYKTVELTKICLRLIRKWTDPKLIQVVVIDNDSQDASTDYLRSLEWITLIERPAIAGESGGQSHARALDLGMAHADTPYLLSIHTDSWVHHPQWLEFLLESIESEPGIAGVGSWKLESKPLLRRMLKGVESAIQRRVYPLIGKGAGALEGEGENFYYLRSHCALYRTEPIRQLGLSFAQGNDTAGKMLHKGLEEAGHKMIFLPSETLIRYLYHANHATMVLNPELGSSSRSVRQGTRRIKKLMDEIGAEAILQDVGLDR